MPTQCEEFNRIIEKMDERMKELEDAPMFDRFDPDIGYEPAVYVFYENGNPIYVGRSNVVKERIQQHGREDSKHNKATLAFNLANDFAGGLLTEDELNEEREILEKNEKFQPIFLEAKRRVAQMRVKFIKIKEPVDQAIFEIYAALKLKTPYNDFDNH